MRPFKTVFFVAACALVACGGRATSQPDGGLPDGIDNGNPPPVQTTCTSNKDCGAGRYCYYKSGCGTAGPGTCQKVPGGCTADCPGVCGCDGSFYCNACGAAQARVSVDLSDGCKQGNSCSTNADCVKDKEYCHLDSGCIASGAKMGRCTSRPQSCPSLKDPVCGCDGKTHGNSCAAHWSGTNIAHKGACSDPMCSKASCVVVNDCCSCTAIDTITMNAKPCPAMCEQPLCGGLLFKQPQAYCVKGRCFLTDAKTKCSSDKDCALVNDCCTCAALPKAAKASYCSQNCLVSSCEGMGAGKAKARCLAGICKVSF